MSNACFSFFRGFGSLPWRPCASIAPNASRSISNGSLVRADAFQFQCVGTITKTPWLPTKSHPSNLLARRKFSSNATVQKAPGPGRPPKAKQPNHRTPPTSPKKSLERRQPQPRRLPFGTLPPHELLAIFGQELPPDDGNAILRILQERRLDGELLDKGVEIKEVKQDIPQDAILKALAWLRKQYPMDEKAAAEAWAIAETEKLAPQLTEAERLEIFKVRPEADNTSAQTSRSVLDEWTKFNEQKREAAKRESIESGEASKNEEMAMVKAEQRKQEMTQRLEERKRFEKEAMVSGNDTSIPERSAFSRLFPSTVFAVVSVTLLMLMAWAYRPPPKSMRIFPEVPTVICTLTTMTAVNMLVYYCWRKKRLWKYMNLFFLVIPAYPVSASLLFNVFSHQTLRHLTLNVLGLWIWGLAVHEDIGRGNFVTIWMAGGILGSLASLYFHVLMKRFRHYSCGASGALFTIMGLHAYLFFKKRPWMEQGKGKGEEEGGEGEAQKRPRFLGMPGYYRDALLVSLTLLQFPAHLTGGITGLIALEQVDWIAHLGGLLSGPVFGAWLMRLKEQQAKEEEAQSRLANMTDEELLAEHYRQYEKKLAAKRREENAQKPKPTPKASFVRPKD